MPARRLAVAATVIAALITLIAVIGTITAITGAPAHTPTFMILTGFGILTVTAGINAARTTRPAWGYLLTTGMVLTTGFAFWATSV